MKKISFIFGTRPEAIKLAPLINYFKKSDSFFVSVCSTGQHKEMLKQILPLFDIEPDFDLDLMTENQSLAGFVSKAISSVDDYLDKTKPDYIVVQGDTSTVFAASLCAFFRKIKIIHIEAGLRTGNKFSPFPEEMNRVLTGRLADFHMAPTQQAKKNLLKENIDSSKILVTGNTGIDSILFVISKMKFEKTKLPVINQLKKYSSFNSGKLILVTGHRRENFGSGFENLCNALSHLASKHKDFLFIYPVHLNPNVKKIVYEKLSNIKNIILLPPADYRTFIKLMDSSYLILTDSGGVQEEAPTLGVPVLVLRDTTERPEGVTAGCSKLIGTNPDKIINSVSELIEDKALYKTMSLSENPYGDGKASKRIFDFIHHSTQ